MKSSSMVRIAQVASLLSLAACGAPPLTDELSMRDQNTTGMVADSISGTDTEAIEDQNVRELSEQALTMLGSAREYFDAAYEQHRKRKREEASLLARIGLIYYNAAENFHRTAEARVRLNAANSDFEVQRQRRNEAQTRIASETELITLLGTINSLFAANEELRRQLASFEQEANTVNRALYAIQEARRVRREAEGVNARRYAASAFDTASASLQRASTLYDDEAYEQAAQVALEALSQFQRAIDESRPGFASDQERLLANNDTARAIFDRAIRAFGDTDAYVDNRGIVVVMPFLFAATSAEIRPEMAVRLDEIAALLSEFSRQRVSVEGHTRDEGSTADNATLAQQRADAVRSYLANADIRGTRIDVLAMGEEVPRYSNETEEGRANNDRVEIIFLF